MLMQKLNKYGNVNFLRKSENSWTLHNTPRYVNGDNLYIALSTKPELNWSGKDNFSDKMGTK